MNKANVPEGYHNVIPYLIVNGAAAFIKFMQDVFDAEEKMKHMRNENIIQHAELLIGDSYIMLADSTEASGTRTAGMFIYVDDADTRYGKALKAGATVITGLSDQNYGRSGGIKDPFGNTWWITSVK